MNTKNLLVVGAVLCLGLATLGVSVGTLNLVPCGLCLYVASKLAK